MWHLPSVIAVAILAIVYLSSKVTKYLEARRFKKAHGCKPCRQLPQSERIIGWGLYRTQLRAVKNRIILKTALGRFRDVGDTWSAVVFGRHFINTMDPENIKTILATNFEDWGLGKRIDSFGPLLGEGIFTTDGKQWEHSRALVRPNFTRNQVADLDTFETHICHLISRIPRNGETVDLQPLFFKLTLDSATEFLFGQSVNSLCSIGDEDTEIDRFGKAFDAAQKEMDKNNRALKRLSFGPNDFLKNCKTVHVFVDKIVNRALEKSASDDSEKLIDGKEHAQKYIFLDEMVKATRDPKRIRDLVKFILPRHVLVNFYLLLLCLSLSESLSKKNTDHNHSELLNILLAGRDTTAGLLSNTFHVLARRPDIWNKLKAEVDELHGRKPDYDTLRNMKYLKHLLNECLRLYPVVPSNARFATRATTIPHGGGPDGRSPVYIPKGGIVAYSVFSMHRRKDIYGPDAEEFKPERWDATNPPLRPGWGYLPFNGGPRICVGQQFALTEASYTIVRLVQEFSAIESRDPTEWVEQLALTLSSGNGVQVALTPRS
ncbi:cytochrome P450 [Xylogone sp. PMI_703]|nr:cytochrome P450 [Xylogone sp. PMI_703]